ncbi:uncharacterized protein LOC111385704 [Olea europaea var. sylvestris]|uniref:uncharacterized protein LOC111385704 n=1 Tax=Olea europaea var. sylvestris TaxID=158386 RepID=UPI000C1CD457|nr:uncharacterized protein LOC111385704 [Olea europaea var. sylvestris]
MAQEVKLFKATEVAAKLNVEPLDALRFSVKCACNTAYMVNLTDNRCTYNRFQLECFPCEHVVALVIYRDFEARTLFSPYYTADSWIAAYAKTIFPLPNEVEWKVPDYILPLNTLLPPEVEPCDFGRPHKSRILSIKKFPRYGRCRAIGNIH